MTYRVLITTAGSLGDLYPYLAVGRELLRHGHTPVLATAETYRARVEAEGIEFRAVRPNINPADPIVLRQAMDRRRGPEYIIRNFTMPYLRETLDDVMAAAQGCEAIVTHAITYASVLAARKTGTPWIASSLSPMTMFSASDPPLFDVIPFGRWFSERSPVWQRAFIRLSETYGERWIRPYRELERELGLERGPSPIFYGQYEAGLTLVLFSRVLAEPQPDWPANTVQTGFAFYEHGDTMPRELEEFFASGNAPVVFTLGSAAVGVAGDFYEESARAVDALGCRAVFLVGSYPANYSRHALPAGAIAVPYAPHARVFARAAAIVHQGGVGTTAEAMRSGRPMLVVPYSHDQPDNATRLERAGVARVLPRHRYNARLAAEHLRELLREPSYSQWAQQLSESVQAERGASAAADAIVNFISSC